MQAKWIGRDKVLNFQERIIENYNARSQNRSNILTLHHPDELSVAISSIIIQITEMSINKNLSIFWYRSQMSLSYVRWDLDFSMANENWEWLTMYIFSKASWDVDYLSWSVNKSNNTLSHSTAAAVITKVLSCSTTEAQANKCFN